MKRGRNKPSSTGTASADANVQLHFEVVVGVVRIMLAIRSRKTVSGVPFNEMILIGCSGSSDLATTYITEFVKDAVCGVTNDQLEQVAVGDYSNVWRFANRFLSGFGHPPVNPVPALP